MSSYGEIQLAPSYNATYAFSSAFFTAAASATDVATVVGSASKTVRVLKILLAYSNSVTAAGAPNQFTIIKRSAANTGGTSTALTAVPLDSTNAAATCSAVNYTANPGALGAAVGNVTSSVVSGTLTIVSSAGASSAPNQVVLFAADKFGQPIVLRGVAQCVSVNANGASLTGTNPLISVTFVVQEV